jgi:hypothetical protein
VVGRDSKAKRRVLEKTSRSSFLVDEFPVRHNRNPMQPTLQWTEDFAMCTFRTEGNTTLLLHLQ